MTSIVSEFNIDIAIAREAMAALKRDKGARPAAARAFLNANSHEARLDAIEEWGAGFVRRGLFEAAKFHAGHGKQEWADALMALRTDITLDGDVFPFSDEEVEDAA